MGAVWSAVMQTDPSPVDPSLVDPSLYLFAEILTCSTSGRSDLLLSWTPRQPTSSADLADALLGELYSS